MEKFNFKVVIVGGSVSGLSLANMLEKLNVDYVVLESHRDIAPQVGASIGLQASGLRILDQLGCADTLLDIVDNPLQTQFLRDSEAAVIAKFEGISSKLEDRHGYPTIFIDRQMLLATLYENLTNKDKVLTGAKVQTIKTLQNGVEVVTADGREFKGDLLVGADGVYSVTRQEMWRHAKEMQSAAFPKKDWNDAYCAYKCIFGISHPLKAMPHGTVQNLMNRDYSYLVIAGPGGRIYWFLFVRLSRRAYGDAIPKYTKEDEQTLAKEHSLDPIVPGITFGDLYEAKTSSVLTPLHEYALSEWHFGRSFLVGDSSHKFEPITGHGGNSAIETAASLVNHLTDLLQSHSHNKPDDPAIEKMFREVQASRFERVSWLIKEAHTHQQTDALETLGLQFLGSVLPRVLDTEAVLNLASAKLVGAQRLRGLPVPPRYHSIPYEDELPASVWKSAWLSGAFGLLSQAGIFWAASRTLSGFQVPTTFAGEPLRQLYTGVPAIDRIFTILVSVFGASVFSLDRAQRVQIGYFMPIIATSVLDWTVDSYRLSDNEMKTVWPSVAGAAYQLLGIGKIAPLYNIARTILGNIYRPLATSAVPSRDVPIAASLGIVCGYVLPSILMFTPFRNFDLRQKITAFWQPSPVYVGLLTAGFLAYSRRAKPVGNQKEAAGSNNKQQKLQRQQERRHRLISMYSAGFAVTTIGHLVTMYTVFKDPKLSISRVFAPSIKSPSELGSSILNFLQWDMGLYSASAAVHGLQSILEFRCQGYVTTSQSVSAALAFVLGHAVVGPAAANLGLGMWKEKAFLNLGI